MRGVNFSGMLRAARRRFGDEAAERIVAGVGGEIGAQLRKQRIAITDWYPVSAYDALLASIERELPGVEAAIRELSRAQVVDDLSGLFRALTFVVSPDFALVNASRAAALYWDGGRVSVVRADAETLHFRFSGYDGFTRRCWEDFAGGVEGVMEAMRLGRLETRVVVGEQISDCDVIVRYRT